MPHGSLGTVGKRMTGRGSQLILTAAGVPENDPTASAATSVARNTPPLEGKLGFVGIEA